MSEQLLIAFEEWRPVPGYEGRYEVSNWGRVRSYCNGRWPLKKTPHLLVPAIEKKGYLRVPISRNGVRKCMAVHRLVLDAFVPPDPTRPQTNHKDGVKSNNRLSNLERATASENILHSFRELAHPPQKGSSNGNSKLKEADVIAMFELKRRGVSSASIAARYGMCYPYVNRILAGKFWRHLGLTQSDGIGQK